MSDQGSVTVWLDRLKAGEERDEAVAQLWARYFTRLVNRARQQLRSRARASDEEDVALAAFDSFVRAAEAGRFPRLDDRNDLWQLLLVLTARKAANVLRDENRQRRGRGRVFQPLSDGGASSTGPAVPSDSPDPAEVVALVEQVEQLLGVLGTDELRRVAVWALEGYTNHEIADRLGKSVVTAERKLRLIRGIWHTHVPA
jgi:DNA-directed RNA polymerase specialized sigma24 family protein